MKSTIAAVIGGLLGALIWGAIAHFTGFEVGYVAWGIGFLVGFLSAMAGGSGTTNGAICALVTVLALVGGKYVAVKMSITKELKPLLEPSYAMQKDEAEKFAELGSEDEWVSFIADNGYSESPNPSQVTAIERQEFKEVTVPLFEKLNDGMDYDDYQNEMIAATGGITEIVKESFGMMDILFFLLGIFTAFKVGTGSDEVEA